MTAVIPSSVALGGALLPACGPNAGRGLRRGPVATWGAGTRIACRMVMPRGVARSRPLCSGVATVRAAVAIDEAEASAPSSSSPPPPPPDFSGAGGMADVYDVLAQRLIRASEREATRTAPYIVALAGVPGSGKSTVAKEVAARVNAAAGQARPPFPPVE